MQILRTCIYISGRDIHQLQSDQLSDLSSLCIIRLLQLRPHETIHKRHLLTHALFFTQYKLRLDS